MWLCMWKLTISEEILIRFLDYFNIFALCEQFWKKRILGPLLRQKGSPFCQKLGPLFTIFGSPCDCGTVGFINCWKFLHSCFRNTKKPRRLREPKLLPCLSRRDFSHHRHCLWNENMRVDHLLRRELVQKVEWKYGRRSSADLLFTIAE